MTAPNIRPTLSAPDSPTCSGKACPAWRGDHCITEERCGYPDDCAPMLRRLLATRTEERDAAHAKLLRVADWLRFEANSPTGLANEIESVIAPAPPATGTEEGGEG